MGKYAALAEYLKNQAIQDSTTLSFGELNRILGFSLPASAWNHRPWWANQDHSPQARGWLDAGFIVESVNQHGGTVRFSRKTSLSKPSVSVETIAAAPSQFNNFDECHLDLEGLRGAILEVIRLAGHSGLRSEEIQIQWASAPHKRPGALPNGYQAVYCFLIAQHCLKVGKAGPNSGPRYISQHYSCSAPSTLAKSILANKDSVQRILSERFHAEHLETNEHSIGGWIEKHAARLNILIPATSGPHVLSLVEAFMQCRLQPMFEG